jgi:hypothetical protein
MVHHRSVPGTPSIAHPQEDSGKITIFGHNFISILIKKTEGGIIFKYVFIDRGGGSRLNWVTRHFFKFMLIICASN